MIKKTGVINAVSATLIVCVVIFFSSITLAEQKLMYHEEQALKGIAYKLSRLIKEFKTYKALHEKGTYTKKPAPGLGIIKEVESLQKEFDAQKFPPDLKKVKNMTSWFEALKKNTPILEQYYLEGYEKHLQELKKSDIENFPDYKADIDRLKQMYKNYKNPRSVFGSPEKAVKLVPQFKDEYAFFKNLPQKYALPIKAKKAGSIETWIQTNEKYLDKFQAYQDDYAKELPGLFENEMDQASRAAQKAKSMNKPAFFKGGVAQRLSRATGFLTVLEAIKGKTDPEVLHLVKNYNRKKEEIDAIENTMAAELLAAVQTPPDTYRGSDKNKLQDMIKTEWEKLYPDDQILAIRFHAANWTRTTNWKWNNGGWYKVDTSVLPAKVIIKTNKDIATIYRAFINKNHLKGDALNVGAHTKTHGYVIEKMLVKNFDR